MKLYLVRHGETALNEKGCYYGKTDAVLSVRGIEQAKYLQHIFKEVSFDYVVASPLKVLLISNLKENIRRN